MVGFFLVLFCDNKGKGVFVYVGKIASFLDIGGEEEDNTLIYIYNINKKKVIYIYYFFIFFPLFSYSGKNKRLSFFYFIYK